ncbi:alpha-galactosidase [Parenemella sanctibonifatiensis]|uniref:Alpha-galactosidase n=1 Tax=Parenemella sanctibonifatiensis TaxID=2016505 RepID=A0A255EH41_9ACTN|nr:alpha-galactosidase [Parenemella sanctibonifatiensis]OYN90859.1 hypothetical protein CGZ91_05015 [Parenemella sanctibonifatiensis]
MTASVRLDNGDLLLENDGLSHRVGWSDVGLTTVGFTADDHAWVRDPGRRIEVEWRFEQAEVRYAPVSGTALRVDAYATVNGASWQHRFWLPHGIPVIGYQLVTAPSSSTETAHHASRDSAPDGGPEIIRAGTADTAAGLADRLDAWQLTSQHLELSRVRLLAVTDRTDNLVHVDSYHASRKEDIELAANLVTLTDPADGAALTLVKEAPAPEHRPVGCEADVGLYGDRLELAGNGRPDRPVDDLAETAGYVTWLIPHRAGAEQTTALHRWQQWLRPYQPGRDALVLSNTWGDFNRHLRMSQDFIEREIDAAARIGIEVVQLDDGWQRGASPMTTTGEDEVGIYQGFWDSDDQFWAFHAERFPDGLAPLVQRAKAAGVRLGLWYAPDSASEFANWQRDVDTIARLWADHELADVKLDAVSLTSAASERRLVAFYEALQERVGDQLLLDTDVTAGVRLGYWGTLTTGPLFVENRYVARGSYWPHHTLRNLWQLAHVVHPQRLRMEFANVSLPRQHEWYADDPLAPGRWRQVDVAATVLAASPLAWLEVSELPIEDQQALAELLEAWRELRECFAAPVHPVGAAPNGWTWAGFVTEPVSGKSAQLAYRPLGDQGTWQIPLPGHLPPVTGVEVAHGDATATVVDGAVEVSIGHPLGHALLHVRHD